MRNKLVLSQECLLYYCTKNMHDGTPNSPMGLFWLFPNSAPIRKSFPIERWLYHADNGLLATRLLHLTDVKPHLSQVTGNTAKREAEVTLMEDVLDGHQFIEKKE